MERFRDYNYLIDTFSKEVIENRHAFLAKRANRFICESHLEEEVILNHEALNLVVLDYFADIARLKDFSEIEHTNKNKITAYTSYWWLRRKPIQIVGDDLGREELVYINEKFISTLIAKDFLYENAESLLSNQKCIACVQHIYYHLRFRTYTPQVLELLLMGIDTGIEIGKILGGVSQNN